MEVYHRYPAYLIFIFFNSLPNQLSGLDGDCSRVERVSTSSGGVFYYKKNFCCDNYEVNEDRTCQECNIGFTSKAGLRCTPCAEKTCGVKCAEECRCNPDERCDRLCGCALVFDNFETTSDGEFIHNNTQIGSSTQRHVNNENVPLEQITQTKDQRSTQRSTNDNKLIQDLIKRQIFAFSIGVGCLLLVMVFTVISLYLCWMRRKKREHALNTSGSGIQVTQSGIQEENTEIQDEEHDYIDIEEENMHPESLSGTTDSERSSCNQLTNGGTDSEGYLHPYHSLVTIEVRREKDIDFEKCLAEKHLFDLNTHDSKHSRSSLTVHETNLNEEICVELN